MHPTDWHKRPDVLLYVTPSTPFFAAHLFLLITCVRVWAHQLTTPQSHKGSGKSAILCSDINVTVF